jgi:hypothetical protein
MPGGVSDGLPTGPTHGLPGGPSTIMERNRTIPFGHRAWLRPDLNSAHDIKPRPDDKRIGPIRAGKLLARKRPHLIPVYDKRVREVLGRARPDGPWWHDLRCQLITDSDLVRLLQAVRARACADHMSLLRVFDVMYWMFSWEAEVRACSQELPG